ncbi:MAG: PAS domain-containing sensor histidine kinase [Thermoplasmatales archaeon]|nr:MAG: PAS domain-containing sensor histidine kinase [Thermoplasmatales archaeon]
MKDEPEIIKTLRKEESLGKLQCKIQSAYKSLEMPEELAEDVKNENLVVVEDDELRESRRYFHRMFNSMADPVVIVDSKGKFLEINDKVEEVTGFTKEELLGKNFLRSKIVTKKSKGILLKNLAKRMMGVDIAPYEIEVLTKDGKKLPYEVNATKIEYERKTADMVVFRDITKRKQVEEDIKRARDDYLNITNLTGDIIVKVDSEGRWTFLNDGACQFWGKSREELLGIKFADYLHPEDAEKTNVTVQELIKTKQILRGFINRQKTPFGWRTVQWNGTAIFDKEGRYIGFQATGRDITDRKKMEETLRENNERFTQFFENEPGYCYMISPKGVILDVNKAALKILGYNKEELVGKPLQTIYTPESISKMKQLFMRWKKTGQLKDEEIVIISKEGERRTVLLSAGSIKDKDGKILRSISIQQDITKRKKTEEKLKEAHEKLRLFNSKLEEKVKERTIEVENLLIQKDEFINQLSHDLGSPLTPLTALLPMIEEKEQDPHLKEELGVINRNVKYLNALVGKTIELAMLNSPETELSLDTTNLLDEIKAVIENNKLVFEENELEILNRVDKRIIIKADKSMLGALFDNLISNAVKYSPNGGTITIDAQDDGEWVTVSIKDIGIGMTREELNHIFEEFYKADWSRHDHMSSGLGLTICKRIVKIHGGHIWAESPGKEKGTTMFFTIPSS